LAIKEVDLEVAEKLLKKAFYRDERGLRPRRGESFGSPLDQYKAARFYTVASPKTPNIWVFGRVGSNGTPVFSDQFSTTKSGVLVAVLS
jgi:hypothetical protein